MATAPSFAAIPRNSAVAISTANANRDGTGTVGTAFTAGSSGSRIDRVTVKATGTTTAGMVRLFVYNGSTYFLWREVAVAAVTPSGTLAAFSGEVVSEVESLPLLVLPNGYSLRASTHNAEAFSVIAEGGDF